MAAKINAVTNLKEMMAIFEAFGISTETLETLNELKKRAIEEINESQKRASWSPGKVNTLYSNLLLDNYLSSLDRTLN